MKIITLCSAAALCVLPLTYATAQDRQDWRQNTGSSWNGQGFWQGAPQGPRERIDFLQRRIDQGIADGSLDPHEARRAQYQLSGIRRDAMRMRGHMTPASSDMIQRRLDDLGRRIHWMRSNDQAGYPGAGPRGEDDRRFATDYDASRYYKDDPRYTERQLSSQDQVYRGSDGRYYCKRNDGTTGLIVGAVGGGVLGNVIEGGHNRVAGTLIGGTLGAIAGKAIDQNSNVRCR
jgi:hypothetical protein